MEIRFNNGDYMHVSETPGSNATMLELLTEVVATLQAVEDGNTEEYVDNTVEYSLEEVSIMDELDRILDNVCIGTV